jgi:hypothetical protein
MRLSDPWIDDVIQVGWEGKFRLHSTGSALIHGQAFWPAQIVNKCVDRGYLVRYTGWNPVRWDQWKKRDNLRWPVDFNSDPIEIGDDVEIWLVGKSVPGAWLRSKLSTIDPVTGMYIFNDVCESGEPFQATRDVLRKVHTSSRRSITTPTTTTADNNVETTNIDNTSDSDIDHRCYVS